MGARSHLFPNITSAHRRAEMACTGIELFHSEYQILRRKYANAVSSEYFPFGIVQDKLSAKPLRAFFIRTLFEYLGTDVQNGQRSKLEALKNKLGFVAETLLCIQYYNNQIFDRKGGIVTKKSIDNHINLRDILESDLLDYIDGEIEEPYRHAVRLYVRKTLRFGAAGQILEDQYNTYECWQNEADIADVLSEEGERFINREVMFVFKKIVRATTGAFGISGFDEADKNSKSRFLSVYFKKIYLRNAALYIFGTQLVLDIFKVEDKRRESLLRFATWFALMHQLVNDNADLVPSQHFLSTCAKSHLDAMSDLRNNIITLPVMIHLLQTPDSTMKYILERKMTDLPALLEMRIFREITQRWSIYIAMTITKAIKTNALKALYAAGFSTKNERAFKYLEDLCNIADNNKFYRRFYDEKLNYARYSRIKKNVKS